MQIKTTTEIVDIIIGGLPQTKKIMLAAIKLVNLQFEANYTAIILQQKRYQSLADTQPFFQSLLENPLITDEQKQVVKSLEELKLFFLARKLVIKFARQSLRSGPAS